MPCRQVTRQVTLVSDRPRAQVRGWLRGTCAPHSRPRARFREREEDEEVQNMIEKLGLQKKKPKSRLSRFYSRKSRGKTPE